MTRISFPSAVERTMKVGSAPSIQDESPSVAVALKLKVPTLLLNGVAG
jgi:hypothetical protein